MEGFHQERMKEISAHSNEKEVLRTEILKYVEENDVRAVLDIGPGDGVVSLGVAGAVDTYLGIESNEEYCEVLEKQGLYIQHTVFSKETEVNGKFDLILFSHTIFDHEDSYPEMLEKAYSLLNDGGMILVISNNPLDGVDEWQNLRKEMDVERAQFSEERFKKFLDILEVFGEVESKSITTKFVTDDKNTIISILSFLHAHGWEDKYGEWFNSERLSEIVDERYKVEGGYEFPFQHLFISVRK